MREGRGLVRGWKSRFVLLSHLPLLQGYAQNGMQQRKCMSKISVKSKFFCHLMQFGSYRCTAIKQFCFPGCQMSENCCEWVSGPAKGSLVPCQLQWLRLARKHTACPALLIRPPHPAGNSHARQKRAAQVLISQSVGDKLKRKKNVIKKKKIPTALARRLKPFWN